MSPCLNTLGRWSADRGRSFITLRVAVMTSLVRRGRKLLRLLAIRPYRRALVHGVGAALEHEHTPLPHNLRTVLDVGANRGQFALIAARRWPEARLVCFEPLPHARAVLERVLRRHRRFDVVDAALSDHKGMAQLHVAGADDSSSLLPITQLQVETFPGTEEVSTLQVRTLRLDEEVAPGTIDRPALLKIDVQGAELSVLRGAVGLLPDLDAILVESSFAELYAGQALADDVIRFLHASGFALVAIAGPTRDAKGNVLQADLVFRPYASAREASV